MGDQESPTVIKLSGVALDNHEINLISRGLPFCPNPGRANKETILNDIKGYFRGLHFKEFFLDGEEQNDNSETQTLFRPPSTWMPPKGRGTALKTYFKKIRMDVERKLEINNNKRCKDNLSSIQRNALWNL